MVKFCPICNAKNSNTSSWCTNCSSSLAGAQIIEDKQTDAVIDDHLKFQPEKERPPLLVGFIIFGLIAIGFLSLVRLGMLVYAGLSETAIILISASSYAFIGTTMFLIAIFCFILIYGLWNGKPWAWKMIILLIFLLIVSGIINFDTGLILEIIVYLVILVLLVLSPNVRAFFTPNKGDKKSFPWIVIGIFIILTVVVYLILYYYIY